MTNSSSHSLILEVARRFTQEDRAELLRWGIAARPKGWAAAIETTDTGQEYAVLVLDDAADGNRFIVAPIGAGWEVVDGRYRHGPWTFRTLRRALEMACPTLPGDNAAP